MIERSACSSQIKAAGLLRLNVVSVQFPHQKSGRLTWQPNRLSAVYYSRSIDLKAQPTYAQSAAAYLCAWLQRDSYIVGGINSASESISTDRTPASMNHVHPLGSCDDKHLLQCTWKTSLFLELTSCCTLKLLKGSRLERQTVKSIIDIEPL